MSTTECSCANTYSIEGVEIQCGKIVEAEIVVYDEEFEDVPNEDIIIKVCDVETKQSHRGYFKTGCLLDAIQRAGVGVEWGLKTQQLEALFKKVIELGIILEFQMHGSEMHPIVIEFGNECRELKKWAKDNKLCTKKPCCDECLFT